MPGLLRTEREPFEACSNNIMKYFIDNDKDIMSFEEFCEGKERWETIRYFFACLHLASSNKVKITTVQKIMAQNLY